MLTNRSLSQRVWRSQRCATAVLGLRCPTPIAPCAGCSPTCRVKPDLLYRRVGRVRIWQAMAASVAWSAGTCSRFRKRRLATALQNRRHAAVPVVYQAPSPRSLLSFSSPCLRCSSIHSAFRLPYSSLLRLRSSISRLCRSAPSSRYL